MAPNTRRQSTLDPADPARALIERPRGISLIRHRLCSSLTLIALLGCGDGAGEVSGTGGSGAGRQDSTSTSASTSGAQTSSATTTGASTSTTGSGVGGSNPGIGRVFFDDFEDGSTDAWNQEGGRDKCSVVEAASDGVAGPYGGARMARCNWNGVVEWNDPASYETMTIAPPYEKKLLYRARFRIDENLAEEVKTAPDPNAGSPTRPKILRIFVQEPSYNDLYSSPYDEMHNAGNTASAQLETWWGGGLATGTPDGWHQVEYFFDLDTGTIRVWFDDTMIRDDSGLDFGGAPWSPLFVTSNWSGADGCCTHDETNAIYFDEVEVFSDAGSGALGSIEDGTIESP